MLGSRSGEPTYTPSITCEGLSHRLSTTSFGRAHLTGRGIPRRTYRCDPPSFRQPLIANGNQVTMFRRQHFLQRLSTRNFKAFGWPYANNTSISSSRKLLDDACKLCRLLSASIRLFVSPGGASKLFSRFSTEFLLLPPILLLFLLLLHPKRSHRVPTLHLLITTFISDWLSYSFTVWTVIVLEFFCKFVKTIDA